MAKIDLSKKSLEELKALRKDVDAAIAGFQDRKRSEAMKALEAVAKQHGMSVSEIVGSGGKGRKTKSAPKYRNPGNSKETWTGRGRQPAWFKAAVTKGASPDSMAI